MKTRKVSMSKSLKLIIEALLFTANNPVTTKELHEILPDSSMSDIRAALKVLQHDYDVMERSFEVKEVAKGFQFRTRSEYGSYILKMLQTRPTRLSKAALETLAIVAYKQPIIRHEVGLLRGVDVGGILRTLLEKNLIRIIGRKDLPGKPLIYGTTKKFLEVFDLKDISSLPKLKEIKALGGEDYEPTSVEKEEALTFGSLSEDQNVSEAEENLIDSSSDVTLQEDSPIEQDNVPEVIEEVITGEEAVIEENAPEEVENQQEEVSEET